jgi:hypothetical protein
MKELGLNLSEFEKVDITFSAAFHFLREWKLFRKAFSGRSVNRSSLIPEMMDACQAANVVAACVEAVKEVLNVVVRLESGLGHNSLDLPADKLLAIVFGGSRHENDSWCDDERRIYEAASQAFKQGKRRDVSQEDWTLSQEKVLREIERLLPAVREQADVHELHLTEGWLLRYTVSFLFPSVYYGEEGERGAMSVEISDEIANEFGAMLNQRIDERSTSNTFSLGNDLLEVMSGLIEKLGWTQRGVNQDALLDSCYRFCHDVANERFRKEQQISDAAAKVFQYHGLFSLHDVNSTVVAAKVFAEALNQVYDRTRGLPTEHILGIIFNVCYDPAGREGERQAILDSYTVIEWKDIVEPTNRAVGPCRELYNGILSAFRNQLMDGFQQVYRWIQEALEVASQKAEELQLDLSTDKLVRLTIQSIRPLR